MSALTATGFGLQHLSLFCHFTNLPHSMSWKMKPRSVTQLPKQSRVTAQIMRYWAQHKAIEDKPASIRCGQMRALHRVQVF